MEVNWLAYGLITMLVNILFVGIYIAIRDGESRWNNAHILNSNGSDNVSLTKASKRYLKEPYKRLTFFESVLLCNLLKSSLPEIPRSSHHTVQRLHLHNTLSLSVCFLLAHLGFR